MSFSRKSASKVALITLWVFDVPMDLVSTLEIPATSITARTGPPAMIPVPSGAGFSITWPEPYRPRTWCGMVVPFKFKWIKFFFACSIALRIAMGTSRALPMPKPALPFWSPTTTRAEKLRSLPPLTTLVTRWMATTWSFKLLGLTSMFRRTASVSLRMILDINLKFQPRFPGCCSQGFHTAVVHVSAAIEHHLLDPGRAGALGNLFSNHFCRRHIVASLEVLARFLVNRAGRNERAAAAVLDDLRVDMPVRAVYAKARPLGRADNARANA